MLGTFTNQGCSSSGSGGGGGDGGGGGGEGGVQKAAEKMTIAELTQELKDGNWPGSHNAKHKAYLVDKVEIMRDMKRCRVEEP